ncbi:MAG: hypothetical protein JXA30_10880 [Deltaproteobacteria bacterium]|nr:hypothetical protein [Deltaproteobacteria bacterium]
MPLLNGYSLFSLFALITACANDIADAATVTFEVYNASTVPLYLSDGTGGPRWLEIEQEGYSLWRVSYAEGAKLCDANPLELGDIPPGDAVVEPNERFLYEWKANAFTGAEVSRGILDAYYCLNVARVPLGSHRFQVCGYQANLVCPAVPNRSSLPPLICIPTEVEVAEEDTHVEIVFSEELLSQSVCFDHTEE